MKKCFIILFTLASLFKLVAQTNFKNSAAEDISLIEQKAQKGQTRSVLSSAADNYDIKYHRCEWEVDPAINYIKGKITTYFKPVINGFTALEFDLVSILVVDSVKYHNTILSFSRLPDDVLHADLPSTIPINTIDSVTVYYQGAPSEGEGFGSFEQANHNGTPIIWTLSEPYGAKDWWPCKQSLNDKIDSLDIIVTTPQVNRVASNGLLISETQAGINKIYHWKTKYPTAAYLVAIGVTNYSVYSDYVPLSNGNSLQVLNYVYPENDSLAKTQTPDIINIIKFYDSLTIDYPFAQEKYGHAQFSWGGGMEHQTMSFVAGFNHPLMAHECAHQWFGDHVTCGSWQDIWLNEGFATYFEGLTEERFFPGTWMGWKISKISNITALPGGSVFCEDTTDVGRIFSGRYSYNKGAYLLHMLRWKLGDSLFFLSLKNYLNDPLLAHHYARTLDLKAHLESISGQNLTKFFNQWYYNQGYPSYQILWTQKEHTVTLTANQTQSHPSVSFFEMPIPIKFIGLERDTTIVFNHQYSGQLFTATINFAIVSVSFDPELHILSAHNSITEVLDLSSENQTTVYPNPANSSLTILSLNNANTIESFEFIDVLGRVVLKSEMYKGLQKEVIVDVRQFPKGTYTVKIALKSGFNFRRFIKD
jgi:aminopeptidase N